MEFATIWIQNHLLAVVAIVLTLVLIYHYLIERDTVVKLSKKYRNSIFEAQSKIFLNATQYLISGDRDLAIKEFLNAVDINRETIETYFALGGLFRSNGEIEKAVSIHRSLIARESISEDTRLRALKELAIDFDKSGFIDKAIETYQDVLAINRDQTDVILSLCRIYEDIGDWDKAYSYRIMLSKTGDDGQAETISHIIVERAKILFEKGLFVECSEELEEAFKFSPSVSAKILWIKLCLANGSLDKAKSLFFEIINEHPMFTSFVFLSLQEDFNGSDEDKNGYQIRLKLLWEYFLNIDNAEILSSSSVILSKIRLLKTQDKIDSAYEILSEWINKNRSSYSEVLKAEYIKLLIKMGKKDKALEETTMFLEDINNSLTKHYCGQCGYNSDDIFWRCPQCHEWETIQFRWKV